MGKRRSREDWDKLVAEYYSTEPRITIKEYCKTKKICMNQFHENKRRNLELDEPLEEIKTSEQSRFQKVKLSEDLREKEVFLKDISVKISIGNIKIEIPASEKETLSFLLKELSADVKS